MFAIIVIMYQNVNKNIFKEFCFVINGFLKNKLTN